MKGWVYVLSNESMPGLVKIGCTTRSVEARAIEIWQTGVPTPFRIVASVLSPDCQALEADIHDLLAGKRVHPSREFFQMAAEQAAGVCRGMLEDQLHVWLKEFLPDHRIVNPDMIVAEGHVENLADHLGEHPFIVASALAAVEPEELRPALARNAELRNAIARRRIAEGEGKS